MTEDFLDLLIIGAGPAGLSAADAAAQEGLDYLVIEKGTIADTIRLYPVGRTLFSTPNELEMREGALHPVREKPTREELLSHYIHFVLDRDLKINAGEEVTDIEHPEPDTYIVHTRSVNTLGQGTTATYRTRRLLFAIGAMAHPRRLNVPGEDLPKVHHRFVEPYPYVRREALVVGGGNSAAEAALFLSEEGARTTMAIWREDWENRDPKAGVFVLVGSDADLTLLKKLGVRTAPGKMTEVPVYDPETFETNVRGVYVAGHFTNARHIKAAIDVPRRIIPLIAVSLRSTIAT